MGKDCRPDKNSRYAIFPGKKSLWNKKSQSEKKVRQDFRDQPAAIDEAPVPRYNAMHLLSTMLACFKIHTPVSPSARQRPLRAVSFSPPPVAQASINSISLVCLCSQVAFYLSQAADSPCNFTSSISFPVIQFALAALSSRSWLSTVARFSCTSRTPRTGLISGPIRSMHARLRTQNWWPSDFTATTAGWPLRIVGKAAMVNERLKHTLRWLRHGSAHLR